MTWLLEIVAKGEGTSGQSRSPYSSCGYRHTLTPLTVVIAGLNYLRAKAEPALMHCKLTRLCQQISTLVSQRLHLKRRLEIQSDVRTALVFLWSSGKNAAPYNSQTIS